MIDYAITTLTKPEDLGRASVIEVQYGTKIIGLDGVMIRSFVKNVYNARSVFSNIDVLEEALKLIPSQARPLVRHLYLEMIEKA